MDRIYNRAEDKNSANIIVYTKKNDTKAYIDKECTIQYKSSELKNAFIKGCIIVASDNEMVCPVGIGIQTSTNTASLMYVAPSTSGDSVTFKSLISAADA